MLSKRDKILRKIRIILDIINVLASVAVVALVVYTFLDTGSRMSYFPVIFFGGAAVNVITGGKHMVSDHFLMGVGNMAIAVVLVVIGLFSKTILGGML